MRKYERERLRKCLLELERALDRQAESLQEFWAAMRQRAAHIDAKFAHAQEVLNSIGRRQRGGQAANGQP